MNPSHFRATSPVSFSYLPSLHQFSTLYAATKLQLAQFPRASACCTGMAEGHAPSNAPEVCLDISRGHGRSAATEGVLPPQKLALQNCTSNRRRRAQARACPHKTRGCDAVVKKYSPVTAQVHDQVSQLASCSVGAISHLGGGDCEQLLVSLAADGGHTGQPHLAEEGQQDARLHSLHAGAERGRPARDHIVRQEHQEAADKARRLGGLQPLKQQPPHLQQLTPHSM